MLIIIFYSFRCEFSDVVCVLLSLSFLLLSLSFFKMMRFSGGRKSGRHNLVVFFLMLVLQTDPGVILF